MAAFLIVRCESEADAASYAEEAAGGALWGVDLGPSSKATSHLNWLGVQCEKSIAKELNEQADDAEVAAEISETLPEWEQLNNPRKRWFLLGKMS